MAVQLPRNQGREVVALCPWVSFRMAPFPMAGIQITGAQQALADLPPLQQQAIQRAPTPYPDHFLDQQGKPGPWNDNPLMYIANPNDPLKEPTPAEASHIQMVNSFLYVCAFARNRETSGGAWEYTNGTDWTLYFHPVDDPTYFAIGERRLYGRQMGGGHQWTRSAFTLPVECNRFCLRAANLDTSLVDGITALHAAGRALGYSFPVRTFALGTSDTHERRREDDLPHIWGATE